MSMTSLTSLAMQTTEESSSWVGRDQINQMEPQPWGFGGEHQIQVGTGQQSLNWMGVSSLEHSRLSECHDAARLR